MATAFAIPAATVNTDAAPVLAVEGLGVRFATDDGEVRAVDGVGFEVGHGECLGIVGESGSGKSQTFLAVMGLLAKNGRAEGAARHHGRNILGLPARALNEIRGDRVTMIFQDPMTSLNPFLSIGRQLTEPLRVHKRTPRAEARAKALAMLKRVGIPEAEKRLDQYPHELSGGMRQRVMIAMALLCEPELLIADEPTTALDVTVQAQILELLADLRRDLGMAIALITHDLGVIARLADRVAVMYAGRVVEEAPAEALFAAPQHPYSEGLLNSVPRLDAEGRAALETIRGQPPNLQNLPGGCVFRDRCAHAFDRCAAEVPRLREVALGHTKACHLEGLA